MKRVLTCAYLAMACSVGLPLFLGAGEASANIVYQFSGVTFDDGGTLTGTFTTNDTFNSLVDFNITTSAAGTNPGFHYTTGTVGSGPTSLPAIIVLEPDPPASLDEILQVTFNGGLTATGAPILIGNADSFEQGPPLGGTHRNINAGEAIVSTSAVPEPSTIALAGIAALAGLLGFSRQRPRA
jgi:hypothetical protein